MFGNLQLFIFETFSYLKSDHLWAKQIANIVPCMSLCLLGLNLSQGWFVFLYFGRSSYASDQMSYWSCFLKCCCRCQCHCLFPPHPSVATINCNNIIKAANGVLCPTLFPYFHIPSCMNSYLAWICISSLSKLFLFSKKETHRPCNEKRNIWIISAGAAAIVKASTRGPSRRLLSTIRKTRKIKLQGKHNKEFKCKFYTLNLVDDANGFECYVSYWFWWCEQCCRYICLFSEKSTIFQSWEVGQVFSPNIIQFATQYSQYLDVQTKYHAQMPCQTPCHAQMSCDY